MSAVKGRRIVGISTGCVNDSLFETTCKACHAYDAHPFETSQKAIAELVGNSQATKQEGTRHNNLLRLH